MKAKVSGEKHFTASVWIRTKNTPQKILLVHHKKMNSWFQPGGHIEQFENPIETAIREVKEETGIDITSLQDSVKDYDEIAKALPTPTFFLEEFIPEHKDEPQHFHLDLMYVIDVEEQEVNLNKQESHKIGWFTREEALQLSIFKNTEKIINQLLSSH